MCHLAAEARNNTDGDLGGEILQIEGKMTSSIAAVNARKVLRQGLKHLCKPFWVTSSLKCLLTVRCRAWSVNAETVMQNVTVIQRPRYPRDSADDATFKFS